jgi:hypothetical protein
MAESPARKHSIELAGETAGQRADAGLAALLDISRSAAAVLLGEGNVSLEPSRTGCRQPACSRWPCRSARTRSRSWWKR